MVIFAGRLAFECRIFELLITPYGYLKADVHRKLNRLVPSIMINAIEDTFE